MANKIQVRRGNLTDLPQLDLGEPGLAVDSGDFYIGAISGNLHVNAIKAGHTHVESEVTDLDKYDQSTVDGFIATLESEDDLISSRVTTLETHVREHTVFFQQTNADIGDHRVMNVGALTDGRIGFSIPNDFGSLLSLRLIGFPSSLAATSGQDIDLFSSYGSVDESRNQHSESDTSTTYDFTGKTGKLIGIDLSGVFTNITFNDICALRVSHGNILGNIRYLCVRLRYTPRKF